MGCAARDDDGERAGSGTAKLCGPRRIRRVRVGGQLAAGHLNGDGGHRGSCDRDCLCRLHDADRKGQLEIRRYRYSGLFRAFRRGEHRRRNSDHRLARAVSDGIARAGYGIRRADPAADVCRRHL